MELPVWSGFRFFVGIHQPCDAFKVAAAFLSVNRLRRYKKGIKTRDWIMDSGAFTELFKYGCYRHSVAEYAAEVKRWRSKSSGRLLAAVAQDYMCEPFILSKTGLSVAEHQRLTIERYDELLRCETGVYILPVLQGYDPSEYVDHIRQYGDRLAIGAWVGVGSVCKRNGNVKAVEAVLSAIKNERPDLRLHGFGLKITALASPLVRSLLYSADSMAWSFSARKQGRDGNSIQEAKAFVQRIENFSTGM